MPMLKVEFKVRIWAHDFLIIYLKPWKTPRSSVTSTTMHIPGPQIMASITTLHRKKPRLPKKWLIHLGRKETKWAWDPLLYQKTKEPAKINGTVPNRSRSQCGKATTPGQSCDHLDLKENNEFSGLKQIESMKNQWVHNDTIKEKVIEITFVTIWGKYLHTSSLWKLGSKEKQLIICLSFWWQLVSG